MYSNAPIGDDLTTLVVNARRWPTWYAARDWARAHVGASASDYDIHPLKPSGYVLAVAQREENGHLVDVMVSRNTSE